MNAENMLHQDGRFVCVNFDSEWGQVLSREAFIWWLTKTDRDGKTSREEARAIFAQPDHPDHAHASEVMALLIAEKFMQ